MTRALVTGANGHVGAHLCRELLANGYDVVAMVRETSDLRGLDGLDLEYRKGDVRDGDSFVAAAAGCQLMFHTAAVYETWGKDPEAVMQPAMEGARNAFAAAQRHGIERIVYTSSIAAIGASRSPDRLLTSADWNDDASNIYFQAKTASERAAHALSRETGVPMVVVNPGAVLGTLDYRVTPSMRLIQNWLHRTAPTYRGGVNLVAASDVARVHRLVAERGTPGQRYIAAGTNASAREVGRRLRALTGVWTLHAPFPRWMQYPVGWLMELAARITNRPPAATRSLILEAVGRWQYYDDRETRALGFEPRPLDDVLREAIGWLLHIDALKPRTAAAIRKRVPDLEQRALPAAGLG